ncbi:hypothetical protein FHETE_271 [Fusarium heterosporum]|uniref:Fido domain-containing protein n=1 Tax=Fusarium heterosporum TaxID=42747 RepID=A0A8H5X4A8_FUSHE|nr:hypothetical protein FHETE_271 [Fusarium heterosporum]
MATTTNSMNAPGGSRPDALDHELRTILSEFPELRETTSEEQEEALKEFRVEQLSRMIYGSNMIEFAGGSLETTRRLCRTDLDKNVEDVSDITKTDPEYDEIQQHLESRNLPDSHEEILQSYRETVQHALTAKYMFEKVGKGEPLSVEIIKEAHFILTYKININENTPWTQYSGRYRDWNVQCGSHVFMDMGRVPSTMDSMIESLNRDIETRAMNPVALASKYCHQFVNIHPFADGNGRMCRLILNALLLKFGFGVVCIGQDREDRCQYLRIAVDSSAVGPAEIMDNYACTSFSITQRGLR